MPRDRLANPGNDSLPHIYCFAGTMKVFLNYPHDDEALAERFRKALADSGLEVFGPGRDHLPGENWASEIARALEESEAMVVLLTPAATNSPPR